MMRKTLNKYITVLGYSDKALLLLSGASSGFSLCLFPTVIGAHISMASTGFSLVFLISKEIVRILLKTIRS